jgi:NAD-reducing hydrogenase small subunit
MERLRLATAWLGGCSGCHMSFLDLDEWLFDLARHFDVVFSPVMDVKRYPDQVDVCLIEGAVASDENVAMAKKIRAATRYVIAFGDCAVTGNVTSLRNPLGTALEVLGPVYADTGDINARIPDEPHVVPVLLDRVLAVHGVIPVDCYLPGCPPPADRIRAVLECLLAGNAPHLDESMRRFG